MMATKLELGGTVHLQPWRCQRRPRTAV